MRFEDCEEEIADMSSTKVYREKIEGGGEGCQS